MPAMLGKLVAVVWQWTLSYYLRAKTVAGACDWAKYLKHIGCGATF